MRALTVCAIIIVKKLYLIVKKFYLRREIIAIVGKTTGPGADKIFAKNRKAWHDYFIEEVYEAGIALKGTEVKSIRAGRVNLKDSFARVENGELFLYNVHIGPYKSADQFNHEPERPRKLLMHRREINKLRGYVQEKGNTLVPLNIYLKDNKIKVEIALAKGKKVFDKRRSKAEKDAKREMERTFKEKQIRNAARQL